MKDWERFMLESNKIEGEDRLNPRDEEAFTMALAGIKTIDDILKLHNIIGSYLQERWVGQLRYCNVTVGSYYPPKWELLPMLMEQYIKNLPLLDSYDAHNQFESIHPFRDLNGRVGRLVWLSKAVMEGYSFEIPFLQKYYYQTLSRTRQ